MDSRLSRKTNILKINFLFIVAAAFGLSSAFLLADLTPAQDENAKKATALVQINRTRIPGSGNQPPAGQSRVTGTAFCIDAAGWFITRSQLVVPAAEGNISLILYAGEKSQTILEAKVTRIDEEKDLALLKVSGSGPFVALQLGTVEGLVETARLTAFGCPFGKMLSIADGIYPAISATPGVVTSLQKKQGMLDRIRFNGPLNSGNSGGPVLDAEGRVVGIMDAVIPAALSNVAIPVNRLQQFLSVLDVEFIAPALTAENMGKPALFKANVLTALGASLDYEAELTLTTAGTQRRFPMKRGADGFFIEEVPVLQQNSPLQIALSANYGQSSLSGIIEDGSFTVDGKPCRLSRVRRLEGEVKPRVILDDGTTLEGAITGLSSVVVTMDPAQVTMDLSEATSAILRPIGLTDKVDYHVAVSKNDKLAKTISGEINIANIIAFPSNAMSSDAAKLSPSPLAAAQTEIRLPGDISDVAVGGGGRFLILYMPIVRQIAVFDTSIAAVIKYLPVASDDIIFAAGADKLIIAYASRNLLQRYSLKTFEREITAPIPARGALKAIAMGANSHGPLLMEASSLASFSLVDPNTLALINSPAGGGTDYQSFRDSDQIRASADGRVFGRWIPGAATSRMQIMISEGNSVRSSYSIDNLDGPVIPGPDGQIIYTPSGLHTAQLKLMGRPESYAKGNLRIPATQGNSFLEIDKTGKLAVCYSSEPRTLATFPGFIDVEDIFSKRNEAALAADKHFYFIPDARMIVAIPETNDRLILQRFDLLQALKNAKIDFLFVASSPVISAAKSSSYMYQIQVESNRGGIAFSLDSGPAGMAITPSGKLTWTTGAAESEASVIVRIADASGKEIFHTFIIRVR
jgi:hypothetical protein